MSHSFYPKFEEKIERGEFSFHPFLASWIRKKFQLDLDIPLSVKEFSCIEQNCPIFTTQVTIHLLNPIHIKFMREKEKINKIDLQTTLIC